MTKKTFLHAEIPPELSARLKAAIPQGMQSSIVRLLMEALATEIETNGHGVLGLILSKEFSVRSVVQILNNQENAHGASSHIKQVPPSDGGAPHDDGGPHSGRDSRTNSREESQGPDREGEAGLPISDVPKGGSGK